MKGKLMAKSYHCEPASLYEGHYERDVPERGGTTGTGPTVQKQRYSSFSMLQPQTATATGRHAGNFAFAAAALHGAPVENGRLSGVEESGVDPAAAQFVKAVLESSLLVFRRVGAVVVQEGGKLLERANITGDGPKPLRALCFLGGLAMVSLTSLQILNIFMMITSPAGYFLQIFLLIFGAITCIAEAKDFERLERIQPFLYTWFKFLTVPLGRGLFYLLIGAIAMSLWTANILLLVAGAYMAVMGIICIMVHLGLRRQLQLRGIEISEETGQSRPGIHVGEPLDRDHIQEPFYQMPSR